MEQKFDIAGAKWTPPPMQQNPISAAAMYSVLLAGNVKLEEGWEIIDFRPPKKDEFHVCYWTECKVRLTSTDFGPNQPRLIARRAHTIESVYGKPLGELTTPEGFEFTGEFRPPVCGEHFKSAASWLNMEVLAEKNPSNGEPRLILRKVCTVRDIYGADLKDLKPPERRKRIWIKCSPKEAFIPANAPYVSEGWVFTGEFRAPKKGDCFLGSGIFGLVMAGYDFYENESAKRLILRPDWKCEVKLEDVYSNYQIPKGYKPVRFAPPKAGETYVKDNSKREMSGVTMAACDHRTPRLVVQAE